MVRVAAAVAGIVVVVLALAIGALWWGRAEWVRRKWDLPPFPHDRPTTRVEQVAMRDGHTLSTELFLPAGLARAPAVLIRNPYDARPLFALACEIFAREGYACALQDCRGQLDSDGTWEPLEHERDDGTDTLRWLVAQPFVDGNVALFGPSYLAATQWAVADALPPEVKTIVPIVFGPDLHDVMWERGMFRHEIFTAWSALMPGRGQRHDAGRGYQRALKTWPFVDAIDRDLGAPPFLRTWLDAKDPHAAYWTRPSAQAFATAPSRTTVPVLMLAGWDDPFLQAQLRSWEQLASRDRSLLVIRPLNHGGEISSTVPGDDTAHGGLFEWPVILPWLDAHLRGAATTIEPGTQVWVRGAATRVTRPSWPPTTTMTRFVLDHAEASNACSGGTLAPATTQEPAVSSTTYRYDPMQPTPSVGGSGSLAFLLPGFGGGAPGPHDQDGLCARDDVLTFTSDVLTTPLHIAGSPLVRLRVASSAPDTAFSARLIDVDEIGVARDIRDGIATLHYRVDDTSPPLPYTPGELVDVTIDLWPIEQVVPAGHRLRVDISSSSFPAFHAHPNSDEPFHLVARPHVATQTVQTGGAGGAAVELPLVDDAAPR